MDWIVSATTLVSMAFIAKKMWQGWAIGLVNQSLWFVLIFSRDDMLGLLPLTTCLTVIYAWALWKWIDSAAECQAASQIIKTDLPDVNVITLPADDGGERMFRQVPAAVIEHDRQRNPALLRVIDGPAPFGDRVELINVLVPEECFTTL